MDFEMAFIDSYADVAEMLTKVLRGIKKNIEKNCAQEMALFGSEEILLPEEIPMMKLSEAQVLLEEKLGVTGAVGEPDLRAGTRKTFVYLHKRRAWLGPYFYHSLSSFKKTILYNGRRKRKRLYKIFRRAFQGS